MLQGQCQARKAKWECLPRSSVPSSPNMKALAKRLGLIDKAGLIWTGFG